jgi:hypothetical protein
VQAPERHERALSRDTAASLSAFYGIHSSRIGKPALIRTTTKGVKPLIVDVLGKKPPISHNSGFRNGRSSCPSVPVDAWEFKPMKSYHTVAVTLLLPAGTLLACPPAPAPKAELGPAVAGLQQVVQAQVVQAQAAAPLPGPVITLFERQSQVIPVRKGFQHTGGGNIDVARPSADTVIITMTGVAVAGAHPVHKSIAALDFNLVQEVEVALEKPQGRKLSLVVEGRVIGLLRSHKGAGSAEESGLVSISNGTTGIVTLPAPTHSVGGGDNLSVNDHVGPVTVAIAPGKYNVQQTFHVSVSHPCSLVPHKASSAEFAPDPALDPLWISYFEPFHGASKKDFGYQVVVKVVAE